MLVKEVQRWSTVCGYRLERYFGVSRATLAYHSADVLVCLPRSRRSSSLDSESFLVIFTFSDSSKLLSFFIRTFDSIGLK